MAQTGRRHPVDAQQRTGWESWAWGGVLRAGAGARLAGKAAAFVGGLIDEEPESIDILHPHGLYRPRTQQWVFHQERDGRRLESIGSLPRTRIEDTVLDLASTPLGGKRRGDPLHWMTIAIERRLTTTSRLLGVLQQRKRVADRQEFLEILQCVEDGIESPLEYHYLHDVERASRKAGDNRRIRSTNGAPGGTSITRRTGSSWSWTGRPVTPGSIGSGITSGTTRPWCPAMRRCATAGTTSVGRAAPWQPKWRIC